MSYLYTTQVSQDYTLQSFDEYIGVLTQQRSVVITLPNVNGMNEGRSVMIKDDGGNAFNHPIVVITQGGALIDNQKSQVINVNYGFFTLVKRNNGWAIDGQAVVSGSDGDVLGPNSSTPGDLAYFPNSTGKNIQDSGIQYTDVVLTGDSRLSNARTPTIHGTTHLSTGSDPIPLATESVDGLMDPLDKIKIDNISSDQIAALAGTNGTPSVSDKYVTDSDPRNSNTRTPSHHASTHLSIGSDPIPDATTTQDGLMSPTDKLFVSNYQTSSAKTSNYSVTAADQFKTFTNSGASGEVDFTLPPATIGFEVGFSLEASSQLVKIIAVNTDLIRLGASVSSSGGNFFSNTAGSALRLRCNTTGIWTSMYGPAGSWTGM